LGEGREGRTAKTWPEMGSEGKESEVAVVLGLEKRRIR